MDFSTTDERACERANGATAERSDKAPPVSPHAGISKGDSIDLMIGHGSPRRSTLDEDVNGC